MGFTEVILLAEAYPANANIVDVIIGVMLTALFGVAGWLCVRWLTKSPASQDSSIDTLQKYEALVRRRIAEAKQQWEAADSGEKESLAKGIQELERLLLDKEKSFSEMKADNLALSAQVKALETSNGANEVLCDVERALENNNRSQAYTKITGLINARDPAVRQLAQAEFIAAQICEKDIRWHDAYAHAKRAYDLGQEVEALKLYARMAWRLGRNEEGVGLQKELVRRAADDHGEESAQYATAINNLAELYYAQGRYEDALPLSDQALAIWEAALPMGHPYIKSAHRLQADIRAALGDA